MTDIIRNIHEELDLRSVGRIQAGQQEVMQLYGDLLESERQLYPSTADEAVAAEGMLLQQLGAAKEAGKHVAIVDGAFDVPHDNHTWYLREARMRAAHRHFGEAFRVAGRADKQAMVASSEIMLIVTLDADEKISASKGFMPEKGNTARPVYTWEARANRIGGFVVPTGLGAYRPVLDLVTVEGDSRHVGTIFESHVKFGSKLVESGLLDTWIMFDEHEGTLSQINEHVGHLAEYVVSVVQQDEARFSIDPRTGSWWSSSAIINMIKGNTNVSLPQKLPEIPHAS